MINGGTTWRRIYKRSKRTPTFSPSKWIATNLNVCSQVPAAEFTVASMVALAGPASRTRWESHSEPTWSLATLGPRTLCMPEPAAVSFSPQMEAQHGAGFGPARRTRSRSILLIQAGYFRTDHGIDAVKTADIISRKPTKGSTTGLWNRAVTVTKPQATKCHQLL
jgi:hypothetical protein